jgi:hypothetical protein
MAEATFTLRAVDSTKGAFASVQNNLDRMSDKVKGMNASFLGRGLLSGLGVGGGFQIALTIIDKIQESYKAAADHAKYIEESTKRTLEYTLRAAKEARTPEQQMADLKKDQAELIKQRQELQKPVFFMARSEPGAGLNPLAERFPSLFSKSREGGMREAGKSPAQQKAIADLKEAEAKLGYEMAKVQEKINEGQSKGFAEADALRKSDQDRRISSYDAGLAAQEKNFDAMIKAQSEKNEGVIKEREALEKLAQSYRDLNAPSAVFIRQIEEVNKVAASGTLGFGFAEAAAAVDSLTIAMNKDKATRMDTALNDLFGDLDEEAKRIENLTKQMSALESVSMDAGAMIAQGFEDAILSGQKLGEVVRALGQDLLRLVFRQQITAPLAKGIGDALFAGFRAEGGPVGAGSAYVVGEEGPELFVPRSSGSIVPNGAMGSSGGGSGGVTVNYNIAAGVSRAELVPILEQERRRLKAEIPDMVRRGGSYRSAFA